MSTKTITPITIEQAHALAYKIACGRYSHDDAEDIAQDVCLSLLDAGPFGRGLVATRTYAWIQKRAERGDNRRAAEHRALIEPPLPLDPVTQVELKTALATLTPEQRDAVDLVVCQGYTERDAATMLGISPKNTHTRIARAITKHQKHHAT